MSQFSKLITVITTVATACSSISSQQTAPIPPSPFPSILHYDIYTCSDVNNNNNCEVGIDKMLGNMPVKILYTTIKNETKEINLQTDEQGFVATDQEYPTGNGFGVTGFPQRFEDNTKYVIDGATIVNESSSSVKVSVLYKATLKDSTQGYRRGEVIR